MVALGGRPQAGSRRLFVAKESPKSGISILVRDVEGGSEGESQGQMPWVGGTLALALAQRLVGDFRLWLETSLGRGPAGSS